MSVNKNIHVILLLIMFHIIFLAITFPAFGASVFLLKKKADRSLIIFKKCLKTSKNDTSKCLNQFSDYIKDEIKVVKKDPKDKQSQQRLDKMVLYLKKSADVFIRKSSEKEDMKSLEKASKISKILIQLSPKYKKKYKDVITQYKNNIEVGGGLAIKLKRLNETNYPQDSYLERFNQIIHLFKDKYDLLKESDKKVLTKIANSNINEYFKELTKYLQTLKTESPSFNAKDILNRYHIFNASTHIKNTNDNLISKAAEMNINVQSLMTSNLKEAKSSMEGLSELYLNSKLPEPILSKKVMYAQTQLKSVDILRNLPEVFPDLQKILQSDIEYIKNKAYLYPHIISADKLLNSNNPNDWISSAPTYELITSRNYFNSFDTEVVSQVNNSYKKSLLKRAKAQLDIATKFVQETTYPTMTCEQSKDFGFAHLTFINMTENDINNLKSISNKLSDCEFIEKYNWKPVFLNGERDIYPKLTCNQICTKINMEQVKAIEKAFGVETKGKDIQKNVFTGKYEVVDKAEEQEKAVSILCAIYSGLSQTKVENVKQCRDWRMR